MANNKLYNDLIPGQRFGRLAIVCKTRNHKRDAVYKCVCDCGGNKTIASTYLRTGRTISCGCIRKERGQPEHLKEPGRASFVKLFNVYKEGARNRGHEFALLYDQFKDIIRKNCFYCDKPPRLYNVYKLISGARRKRPSILDIDRADIYVSGIDRFDNALGYTLVNSRPCCSVCNENKKNRPAEEFIAHCYKVVAHQEKLKGR